MSYKTVSMRKSLRKKGAEPRSWLKVFLVFILCASLLFAVGILLGNFLRSVAGNGPLPFPLRPASEAPEGYFDSARVPVIQAEYGNGGSVGSGTNIQYNAVSLLLRTGAPAASSAIPGSVLSSAMQLRYVSELTSLSLFEAPGTENLQTMLDKAKAKYGYVSGVFSLGFPGEPARTRDLVREYEISLLAELSSLGLDDVVLTDVKVDDLSTVIEFIRDVSERTDSKLKLGIALDFSYFDDAKIKDKINELHYDCGFFALDLRNEPVPALMTPENFVYDRISRIASTVSLYSVRVLVGCGPQEGYRQEAEAALKAGALNIQAVPPAP